VAASQIAAAALSGAKGESIPMMRIHAPRAQSPSILDGTWMRRVAGR
jgi:hypothetical protein